MKLLKLLTNKIVIFGLLIVVQLAWFLSFWLWLSQYSIAIHFIFSVISLLVVIYLINKDDSPSYKIGWIIVVMALPILGGLLYLFFGTKAPQRKMAKRTTAEHLKYLPLLSSNDGITAEVLALNRRAAGTVTYIQKKCNFPAWKNTQTTYYSLGDEMYPEMLKEMEKAEHYIFMEYFIIEESKMWNGILDILKRKAKAGLDVRVMYDDMGSLNLVPSNFAKELGKWGIKCMPFNPFVPFISLAMNNRDHRKILIIDGHTAFNGGINIADEYINAIVKHGHWKDTGIKLQGDAVWNFTVMFLEMWNAFRKTDESIENFTVGKYAPQVYESDGYVVPFGDSPLDKESIGQNIYIDILNQATRYVYIFTPYLIIDTEMQSALRFAAKRGVDVRLVTPGIPDKKLVYRVTRSYYQMLLTDGVKIYEYTPGFLHAKCYVCDDEIAVVGTINMDYRSLCLHFECGTYLYKTASVIQIKDDFTETLKKCRKVGQEDLKQGVLGHLLDSIIRVFAPLM